MDLLTDVNSSIDPTHKRAAEIQTTTWSSRNNGVATWIGRNNREETWSSRNNGAASSRRRNTKSIAQLFSK
jgi:hypothetical protein